jgi:hypothetical protein
VTSYFEVFIETNLMVQSEFDLVFWFVSYKIFCFIKRWGPRSLSLLSSFNPARWLHARAALRMGHAV